MKMAAGKILILFVLFSFSFIVFSGSEKRIKRDILVREAQSLYSGGETEKARDKLNKALALCNSNWEIYNMLGRLEFLRKNYRRAIHYFDRSISYRRNNPEAYLQKGLIYYGQGKMNNAASEFQRAKSFFQKNKDNEGVKRVEKYLRAIECAMSDKGFSIGR